MIIRETVFGPLCILMGYLTFSTNGLWMVLAPLGATPYTLSAFRMTIGAFCLFVLLFLCGKRLSLKGWNWKCLFCYAVGTWAYQLAFYNAILNVGIAVGTVISVGATPIFAGILQWFVYRRAPSKIWYPATALAIVGVVLLNKVQSANFEAVDLLIPLAAGFFSGFSLLAAPGVTRDRDSLESGTMSALCIACLMCPFYFLFPIDWVMSSRGLLCVLALGLINTALGYLLIFRGFKTTKPVVAASPAAFHI